VSAARLSDRIHLATPHHAESHRRRIRMPNLSICIGAICHRGLIHPASPAIFPPKPAQSSPKLRPKEKIVLFGWVLIMLRVPSRDSLSKHPAGTGTFFIHTSTGDTIPSPQPIDITYSFQNARDNGEQLIFRLSNENGNGGLDFTFNENLADSTKDVFRAALDVWKCETGVNFSIADSTTSKDSISFGDFISTVSFDSLLDSQGNVLPVSGRTRSRGRQCTENGITRLVVVEIDMVFQSARPWFIDLDTIGLASPAKDFFSTSVHEIGHAHQLGHALPKGKTMYPLSPSGPNGLRRSLSLSDVAGGNAMIQFSQVPLTCASGLVINPHIEFDCTNSIISADELSLAAFPNPNSGTLLIKVPSFEPYMQCTLRDMAGKVVLRRDFQNVSAGVVTLNIPTEISEGVYILTLQNSRIYEWHKIYIQY